ncbi:MAG: hypothetical protein ACI9FJ_003014 [Alteromonadaceae bacterium]|jgi:hypothetical protein
MRSLNCFLAALSFMLLLSGCSTTVTSLKQDKDKVLLQNQGFVLLGIQTNRSLKQVEISGPQNIDLGAKDIKDGTNYLLVDLEAGVYTIERVLLDSYWRTSFDDEEPWTFEVVPGKISYVGHLEIVQRGNWRRRSSTELVNRSSEALEFLADNYPNILANRTVSYGGPGQDRFFNYLAETYSTTHGPKKESLKNSPPVNTDSQ